MVIIQTFPFLNIVQPLILTKEDSYESLCCLVAIIMCVSIINDSLMWVQSQRNSRLILMIHLYTISSASLFHRYGEYSVLIRFNWNHIYLKFTFKVNPLWLCDTIWWHWSRSTLAQVMGCCLMESHYVNQCWLIIKGVQWHSPESNFTISWIQTVTYIQRLHFLNYYLISQDQWIHDSWITVNYWCVRSDKCTSSRDRFVIFVYAPNQWETTLQYNVISHWLSTCTKWSLFKCWCWKELEYFWFLPTMILPDG